jgi:polysaccharide biosynthesis transport protein
MDEHPIRSNSRPHPEQRVEDSAGHTLKPILVSDVTRALRRWWPLLLLCVAAAGSYGWYQGMGQEPVYSAQSVLRLVQDRRALTAGIGGDAAVDQSRDPVLSQVFIISSQAVLGDVVDSGGLRLVSVTPGFRLDLLQDMAVAEEVAVQEVALHFSGDSFLAELPGTVIRRRYGEPLEAFGLRFTVVAPPTGADTARLVVVSREQAVGQLRGMVRAVQRERSDLIDVLVTTESPARSRAIANAVADAAVRTSARLAQQQSTRRRVFIEEQLQQAESELAEAQLALSSFRTRAQVFASGEQLVAQQHSLTTLAVREEELRAEKQTFDAVLDNLSRFTAPDVRSARRSMSMLLAAPEISSSPGIAPLYLQLVEYEKRVSELTVGDWGKAATAPEVERAVLLLEDTQNKLLNAVQLHVRSLDALLAVVAQQRNRASTELGRTSLRQADELHYEQQVETLRALAEQLRGEHQRSRIAETVEAGQLEVLDYATGALARGGRDPNRIALWAMLGLLVGSMAAVGLERRGDSIRTPEELEQLLSVRELGVMPNTGTSLQAFVRAAAAPAPPRPGFLSWRAARRRRMHVVSQEAIRMLRANLAHSGITRPPRVLLVTSAQPEEGKTTTAVSMAIAFARQGLRVLLIDSDLRRPSLDAAFDLRHRRGFADYLRSEAELDEAIHRTMIDGLWLIPAGRKSEEAVELVTAARAAEVLGSLADRFDYIVVDSAPLLAAPDALLFAGAVEGVVFVVRAGKTAHPPALRAIQQMSRAGGPILGGVLNDPDSEVARYGGHYYVPYAPYESQRSGKA